jgi:hypothetical protein
MWLNCSPGPAFLNDSHRTGVANKILEAREKAREAESSSKQKGKSKRCDYYLFIYSYLVTHEPPCTLYIGRRLQTLVRIVIPQTRTRIPIALGLLTLTARTEAVDERKPGVAVKLVVAVEVSAPATLTVLTTTDGQQRGEEAGVPIRWVNGYLCVIEVLDKVRCNIECRSTHGSLPEL